MYPHFDSTFIPKGEKNTTENGNQSNVTETCNHNHSPFNSIKSSTLAHFFRWSLFSLNCTRNWSSIMQFELWNWVNIRSLLCTYKTEWNGAKKSWTHISAVFFFNFNRLWNIHSGLSCSFFSHFQMVFILPCQRLMTSTLRGRHGIEFKRMGSNSLLCSKYGRFFIWQTASMSFIH